MTGKPLTVSGALRALKAEMDYEGAAVPVRDLRLLLAHAMCVDPARLTLMAQEPLDQGVLDEARRLCLRRSHGMPMSQIRGYREFYGRRFIVTDKVLDPRPETETLIEQALREPFSEILDLGTGSGCILITLLEERPDAIGLATDLSSDALQVAKENAEAHGVLPRAGFILGDWLDTVGGRFDLIVSNPPYIAAAEMAGLEPELGFEPRMALTDEGDGLSAYRVIVAQAPDFLRPGGRLMVEIGATQGPAVAAMFTAAGFGEVRISPDLDGRDRVVSGVFF